MHYDQINLESLVIKNNFVVAFCKVQSVISEVSYTHTQTMGRKYTNPQGNIPDPWDVFSRRAPPWPRPISVQVVCATVIDSLLRPWNDHLAPWGSHVGVLLSRLLLQTTHFTALFTSKRSPCFQSQFFRPLLAV